MTRSNFCKLIVKLAFVTVTVLSQSPCQRLSADSVLDLISGFDQQRIQSVYPSEDEVAIGELAKLMYRLQRVDRSLLLQRSETDSSQEIGDAIRFSGIVASVKSIDVPIDLVEFLEFEKLHLLSVSNGGEELVVAAKQINPKLQAGDRVDGTAVVIELDQSKLIAVAAATLRWFPKEVPNVGWQLLRDAGVDVGELAELSSRSKRPLVAADANAFYSMLAAASSLADQANLVAPREVKPITLLQTPDQLSGQWVKTDLETVQITRVFVTNQDRQVQIGSDHYYQIDAVGDLENVVVKIEPARPGDEPVLFEGRYPISLVTIRLPEFLERQIAARSGDDAVVTQLRTKLGVQAFCFRLWSYESDFMKQQGGSNQFGPLLVAVSVRDLEPTPRSVVGLELVGTLAAIAVLAGILATFLWHRKTSAVDRQVRKNRQSRASERIDFPSNSS